MNSTKEECRVRSRAKVRSALKRLHATVSSHPDPLAKVHPANRPGMVLMQLTYQSVIAVTWNWSS